MYVACLNYLLICFLRGSFRDPRWRAPIGTTRWRSECFALGTPSLDTDGSVAILVKEFKVTPTEAMIISVDSCQELRRAVNQMDLYEWTKSVGKVSDMQAILERHPFLVAQALKSERLRTTRFLLTTRACITEDQYRNKFSKESLSRKRVRQLLFFLESTLNFSTDEINKIILSQPKLFSYKIKRFEEVVNFLRPLVDVRAMVKRWPTILTYSVQGRIQPGVLFLQSLGDTRWERVLLKYPQVLTHSVETVLKPKLAYLEEYLDIPTAKQLVTHYPPLLWLSSDLLERKFAFVQESLDLTRQEMESVVETYPQIMGLSIENNLQPTIAFLQTCLSTEQLRDFVLYQPALLAYSLSNRIRPRLEQMKELDISFAYAPAYLMSMTDAKFEGW